ncbi:MAG: TIGR04053 family radical SAM/SPASM domain-containing protein [Gemmatimonadetes bacterium]|nr:TIGR04053 family radical SAM/SPASM domain-containing protein [Gemmatimonadota bacterium]
MPHPGGTPRPGLAGFDFDRAPWIVIWETTRACDLACKHCRAEAIPDRHPDELTTAEAKQLLDDVRRFGQILFVFTGGDALKRPDIVELTEYGARLGLRMAMTPTVSPRVNADTLRRLKEAGLARISVSIDGSVPWIHDAIRGVQGCWEWAVGILQEARRVGLSTQVNTTVSNWNLDDFDNLYELMRALGIVFWEVFVLVPTGRARPEDVPTAEQWEAVFHRMYDMSTEAPFDIKATAAPQYRRVVLQRQVAERRSGRRDAPPDELTAGADFSLKDGVGRARGVNDGDGFMFISHVGEIYPSGFLPLSAGNVRRDDLVEVYRNAPLFRHLRDKSLLQGKCGVCEYRDVCGGSRARAYAVTGDPFEAEPYCAFVPRRYARLVEKGEAEPVEEYFRRRDRRRRVLPTLNFAAP